MKREEFIKYIKNTIDKGNPIIGAASGTGFSAKQSILGGVDFILVLNAGKFRSCGVASLASMLPFENSNKLVLDIGYREIISKKLEKPIIFGACASDPNISHDELLDRVCDLGFDGINNFPSVGVIDGKFREALEENNMGFYREIELMKKAVTRGLITVAYVFDEFQAREMAKVGVDIICVNLGWTFGGDDAINENGFLKDDIQKVNKIIRSAKKINKNGIYLVYGGRINTSYIANYFYQNTDAVGYIGGSSFGRIPLETSIRALTNEFKNCCNISYNQFKYQNNNALDDIVGESHAIRELKYIIEKVASNNINVLVNGESGTGKELIVRAIHFSGKRKNNAFVKLNCAAIPGSILESELFGHEKGAFTGAIKTRKGKFELADKGTLFLDEIGDMDISLQSKLLRTLQQQEIQRVGGENTIKIDVRIICATNKNLIKSIKEKEFREDLYYRLNTIILEIPPLRKRKEDIPLLIYHFLKLKSKKFEKTIPKLSQKAYDCLLDYDWPGNIRELENAIERAIVLQEGEFIKLKDLPDNVYGIKDKIVKISKNEVKKHSKSTFNMKDVEKDAIINALDFLNWNRTEASKYLGISRRTLYNKIKKYNIEEKNAQSD